MRLAASCKPQWGWAFKARKVSSQVRRSGLSRGDNPKMTAVPGPSDFLLCWLSATRMS